MAISIPCPNCNEQSLHRSRSRTRTEKFLKKIIPYRLYRCHLCQWRGWISNRRAKGQTTIWQIILFYLGIIVISFLIAWMLWALMH